MGIVVIVLCLTVAGFLFLKRGTQASQIPEGFQGEVVWLKCTNPECKASYEIDKYEYYKWAEANRNPMALSDPPMACKQCGKNSAYKAIKCEKCGEVFFAGEAKSDFSDRCPKCGFSEVETDSKSRSGK